MSSCLLRPGIIAALFATIFCASIGSFPAAAQTPGTAESAQEDTGGNPQPTDSEVRSLVAALEDTAAREALVRQLQLLLTAMNGGKAAEESQGIAETSASDLLTATERRVENLWHELRNIDIDWLIGRLLLTLLVIAAAIFLFRVTGRILPRLSPAFDDDGPQTEGDATFSHSITRMLKLAIAIISLVVVGEIWGQGPFSWLTTIGGAAAGRAAISVTFVFVAAIILWHVSEGLVDYAIRKRALDGTDGRSAARLKSLIPVIKGIIRIVVATLATLLIMSELGFNIGPLLASAGIVGLAIGFGAQSLVKDFLVGVSMLIEDAATVGDVVEVNGCTGKVVKMDVRVLRLRALDGALYTIPYSEVTTVRNLTKSFSYHLFDLGVSYGEDVDHVLRTIANVASDLQGDDEFSDLILAEPEIFGLDGFGDSALVMRGRIKTKPGEQWRVGREFNRRLKYRFDEEDIDIPFPHLTMFFGAQKNGDTTPGQLVLHQADSG